MKERSDARVRNHSKKMKSMAKIKTLASKTETITSVSKPELAEAKPLAPKVEKSDASAGASRFYSKPKLDLKTDLFGDSSSTDCEDAQDPKVSFESALSAPVRPKDKKTKKPITTITKKSTNSANTKRKPSIEKKSTKGTASQNSSKSPVTETTKRRLSSTAMVASMEISSTSTDAVQPDCLELYVPTASTNDSQGSPRNRTESISELMNRSTPVIALERAVILSSSSSSDSKPSEEPMSPDETKSADDAVFDEATPVQAKPMPVVRSPHLPSGPLVNLSKLGESDMI